MQLALRQNKPLYHIFLDMSKAYDTLDRECTTHILKAYGVGERVLRVLNKFWENHWIVPKQAEFFGRPFQATQSVTQGDVISPTIFNIVVDAILHAWERDTANQGEITIFYADDRYFVGYDADELQAAVDNFAVLLSRMGLLVNPTKTKSMVTKGSKVYLKISSEAYKRRMTGCGDDYISRKRRVSECEHCGKAMRTSSMKDHMRYQHGMREDIKDQEEEEEAINSYQVSMPGGESARCPVPGCPATIKGWFGMRRHFLYRHVEQEIKIEEEGETTRCALCHMYVPVTGMQRHTNSKLCRTGQERTIKRQHQRAQSTADVQFTLLGREIEMVSSFKYLGRWLSDDDDDLIAVCGNIKKARARWA